MDVKSTCLQALSILHHLHSDDLELWTNCSLILCLLLLDVFSIGIYQQNHVSQQQLTTARYRIQQSKENMEQKKEYGGVVS